MVQIWSRRPLGDVLLAPLYRLLHAVTHPLRLVKRLARSILPKSLVQKLVKHQVVIAQTIEVKHRRYTPRELSRMAEQAGFKLIDARGSRFLPSKFFFSEDRRIRWDEQLQKWTKRKPVLQQMAIDYVSALRKA